MEQALTRSQQQLMAEKYDCYEKYTRRLHGDEFMDAALEGFIAAVRRYDQMPAAAKALLPFEAVCIRKMRDYVWLQLQKNIRKSVPVATTSLDAFLEEHGYLPHQCAAPCSVEDDVDAKLLLASISSLLSKEELKMVILQAEGYANQEVARLCGITGCTLLQRLDNMRQRIRAANWSWGTEV